MHLFSLSLCSGLFILPGLQRQADSNSCHFSRWSETTIIYSMVTSWLVCSSLDCSIRVRALVGEIVLCSWAKHLTFTLPLSTQVYKWVPANLILGVTKGWTEHPIQRGSRNTSSRFMLEETGISSGLMGHLACTQTLPTECIALCFVVIDW